MAAPAGNPSAQRQRLGLGAALIALLAAIGYVDAAVFPGAPSLLVLGALAILCAIETSALLKSAGLDPFPQASLALAMGVVIARSFPHFEQAFFADADPPLLARLGTAELGLAAFLFFAAACVVRARTKDGAATLGAGALVILVPTCLTYAADVRFIDGRAEPRGLALLLFLVGVSKIGDIAAYFIGSAVGRHKLIPAVSPGKTWEGALASLIAATGLGGLLGLLGVAGGLDVAHAVAGAVAINVASQFGDLAESLLKRSANVKDSGRWLPQFGGAFDLVDSLFLAAPVFYGFLRLTR